MKDRPHHRQPPHLRHADEPLDMTALERSWAVRDAIQALGHDGVGLLTVEPAPPRKARRGMNRAARDRRFVGRRIERRVYVDETRRYRFTRSLFALAATLPARRAGRARRKAEDVGAPRRARAAERIASDLDDADEVVDDG